MHDQGNRPIPRRLRHRAYALALSGVALVLSTVGLVVVGGTLLYIGLGTLRRLRFFLHPTSNSIGGLLEWLVALVALVFSAALAVGFVYLLVVVVVSVVMLLRQLLSTLRGTNATRL